MDLILWRHAEAEDPRPGLPDERRRLTPKGEKQARKMAKWLKKRLPKNTRILVSPTERTRMTAHALGLPFEIEHYLSAATSDLPAAARWPHHDQAVLIVGHQPMLGRISARLLAGRESDWTIKKAALWWFSSEGVESATQIVLRAVISPDLV